MIKFFLLKNKTKTLVNSKIKIFINNNDPRKIIKTNQELEIENIQVKLFYENNKIQYITSSVKHPKLIEQ